MIYGYNDDGKGDDDKRCNNGCLGVIAMALVAWGLVVAAARFV